MNTETPGSRGNQSASSIDEAGVIEPAQQSEAFPITPDDIVGLTEEERQDETIRRACDDFNRRFKDYDNAAIVREAVLRADPEITKDELLLEMDRLEATARKFLPPAALGDATSVEAGKHNAETDTARQARLGDFVETHFADICPPSCRDLAVKECIGFEDDCRVLFEEADLQLGTEDARDPDLRQQLEKLASAVEVEATNADTIEQRRAAEAALGADVKQRDSLDIPASNAELMAARAKNGLLADRAARMGVLEANSERRNEAVTDDLSTIEQLQSVFNALRAEKGTIGAFRTLLEPGRLKSPDMRTKVKQAIATAQALVNAIPGKSDVVNRILDQSNIDFVTASPVQIFAGFLAEADKSDELTDEEKNKLREVLHGSERLDSGSAVEEALRQGRGVRMKADGKSDPIPYDKDNSLPIRPGVDAYMDGSREIMRARAGANVPAVIDVTGWSAADKADLLKVMSFWTATESVGKTGFVQDIYGLNFGGFTGATEFNQEQVRQMKRAISIIYGGAEGYDGDLGEFDQQIGLVQYQARLLSESGTATGMENDQAGSQGMDTKLGLKDRSGNINPDILRAFGEYTRGTYMTGDATPEDLHRHLFSLYPDLVEPPAGDVA